MLAWELSVTLDGQFCRDAPRGALATGRPEIFNTDQGAQFTSDAFTALLRTAGVQISMDGRGRALDNVFVERLWRSVKYEEVYLRTTTRFPQPAAGWGTTSRSTITSDRTRRWRIGRRRRCTARFLRWCSPAHRQDADGNEAWACGNLADEIPTCPHPSSSQQDGDDLNFLNPVAVQTTGSTSQLLQARREASHAVGG